MADAIPPTLDALLEFIKEFTVEQYIKYTRSTSGAALAVAIRRHFPGFDYQQVGLDRLANAVSIAEERGFVVRDRNVVHLEITPGPSSGIDAITSHVARFQFLRPEIWRALIFVTSNERHFMDRKTGLVQSVSVNDETTIGTHNADPSLVELQHIPTDTQQSWVREFVQGQQDLSLDEAPIDDPQWWVRVPEWLRSKGPEFEKQWRRERSQRVIAVAREWASENKVPEKFLFAPRKPKPAEDLRDQDSEDTRKALLAALSEMSLHELEGISIPIHYVIRHFRAR